MKVIGIKNTFLVNKGEIYDVVYREGNQVVINTSIGALIGYKINDVVKEYNPEKDRFLKFTRIYKDIGEALIDKGFTQFALSGFFKQHIKFIFYLDRVCISSRYVEMDIVFNTNKSINNILALVDNIVQKEIHV